MEEDMEVDPVAFTSPICKAPPPEISEVSPRVASEKGEVGPTPPPKGS